MRVSQSQFEIETGFIRHKPTGALFRYYAHEPIFETVTWSTPESEPSVRGFLKQEIWQTAQQLLLGLSLRRAG